MRGAEARERNSTAGAKSLCCSAVNALPWRADWAVPGRSGTREDASCDSRHADFVTSSTSKPATRGGAVCHPDAIISLQTCPANGSMSLVWPAFSSKDLKNLCCRQPATVRLEQRDSTLNGIYSRAGVVSSIALKLRQSQRPGRFLWNPLTYQNHRGVTRTVVPFWLSGDAPALVVFVPIEVVSAFWMFFLTAIDHHPIELDAAVGTTTTGQLRLPSRVSIRLVIFACVGRLPAKWYHSRYHNPFTRSKGLLVIG